MTSIVEKKFTWFEQYLRGNLKARTLASPFYKNIPAGEDDMFMVFYLKILLDKLDTMKANAVANVPDTNRAEPRLGYRTSVPIPEGGISAIRVGEVPELNLDTIIANTLSKAIKDYLGAMASTPDLSRELSANTDLSKITRTELANLEISNKRYYSFVSNVFHIRDYLKSENTRLITKKIIAEIKDLHEACIAPLNAASRLNDINGIPLKVLFPDVQNSDAFYLNPPDWIAVRTGIIPLGVYPDLPLEPFNILDLFRKGMAAQYTVTPFNLDIISTFVQTIQALYDLAYSALEDKQESNLDEIYDKIVSAISDIYLYHHERITAIWAYPFVSAHMLHTLDTEVCPRLYPVQEALSIYFEEDDEYTPIKVAVFEKRGENGFTLYENIQRFLNGLVEDANGNVTNINVIYDTSTPPVIVTDERTIHLYNIRKLKEALDNETPDVSALSELIDLSSQDFFTNENFYANFYALATLVASVNTVDDVVYKSVPEDTTKVTKIKDACHKFLGDIADAKTSIYASLKHTLQEFNAIKSDVVTSVDASFIANLYPNGFGNNGNYSVKEYKGTLICYKS